MGAGLVLCGSRPSVSDTGVVAMVEQVIPCVVFVEQGVAIACEVGFFDDAHAGFRCELVNQ